MEHPPIRGGIKAEDSRTGAAKCQELGKERNRMDKVCNRCGDVIGNEMAIVDDDGNLVHGSELECVVVLQERIAELEEKNHALDQIARDAKDANKYLDEVLAENAELEEQLERLNAWNKDKEDVFYGMQTELDALLEQNEKMEEALKEIANWAKAYPLKMFPRPNYKLARGALKDVGITLDSISADCMRHVVRRVAEIASAVLPAPPCAEEE